MGTHGGPSRDTFGFSIDITLTMTVFSLTSNFKILTAHVFLMEDMYKHANANAAFEFQRQDRIEQDSREQERIEQEWTEQDSTGENKTDKGVLSEVYSKV
ncbi:hypothetical protein V1477_010480 [Vespula maculifrons]|uniref:Uncharacterized protein n=1 Tax=Vespula maculifrons TaxID=7453 RepID=A0ABD2C9J8_VESMC